MAGQWGSEQCRAAEHRVGDFKAQDLRVILWALSRLECLEGAWHLFDHAKHFGGASFILLCVEPFLMECEQRGLFEHEIVLWMVLVSAAGIHDTEMGLGSFGSASKYVAATRFAQTAAMKLHNSDSVTCISHGAGNSTVLCIWCA